MTRTAKHLAPRKSLCTAILKRYAKAHKPIHVAVTCGIFFIEAGATVLHVDMIVHLILGGAVASFEVAVLQAAE